MYIIDMAEIFIERVNQRGIIAPRSKRIQREEFFTVWRFLLYLERTEENPKLNGPTFGITY
jgi:hypothetical protein